jgi:GNAT superfamily N-acetyltransferase
MAPALYSDKERVVAILADSFADNPSVNLVVKQNGDRLSRIRQLMEYCFEHCFYSGAVYLSDDRNGCALIVYPDKNKFSLKSVSMDIKLVFSVIGLSNLKMVLHREKLIKQNHPSTAFMHLWYIGVDPQHQHKGIGSELLLTILDESRKLNRDIYLETSVTGNINWYKKHGFNVYKELPFASTLYLLKRTNKG